MRYFYDCEFLEIGPKYPVYLVSIGVKCEDGRTYYAEDEDAPLHLANDWVKENVVPRLHRSRAKPRHVIAAELLKFVADGEGSPSLWGYYADYDHVVLAQLFGTMMEMPDSWPKYTLDLQQVAAMLGNPRLPKQKTIEHDALNDAEWNMAVWLFLNEIWRRVHFADLP
jgi:3' exoribonuclease, RNase T-like